MHEPMLRKLRSRSRTATVVRKLPMAIFSRLAPRAGIGPATYCLEGSRSNPLSYRGTLYQFINVVCSGVSDGDRTHDRLDHNQELYH